jgi:hypothetical protein
VKIGRLLLAGGALIVGCAHPHSDTPAPADSAWAVTLDSAQRLVADSQYAQADSILAMFAQGSQGTAGAREAIFWHGVFLLDPANKNASPHEAAKAFDSYLTAPDPLPHRAEALVLQRTTHVIDSLSQSRTMDSVPFVHLVVAEDSSKTAREQEMAKTVKTLQDSLNKTTAELDRIKKRLSTGTGTGTGKP